MCEEEKNTEHLTSAMSGSDSHAAICTSEELPQTTTTKEPGTSEKSKTTVLAEPMGSGHLFF